MFGYNIKVRDAWVVRKPCDVQCIAKSHNLKALFSILYNPQHIINTTKFISSSETMIKKIPQLEVRQYFEN